MRRLDPIVGRSSPFPAQHGTLWSILLALGALLLATAPGCSLSGEEFTSRTISVLEGDLIKVQKPDGLYARVQLAGVDSPERGQPYRDDAKRFTARTVQGQDLTIRVTGRGKAGHLVGEVLLPDGASLNRQLVAAGLAWHRGSTFAPFSEIEAAEEKARKERKGLWKDRAPTPPWEYLDKKSWRD